MERSLVTSPTRRRSIQDKCGIFAVHGDPRASVKIINGLSLLEHRGQDSVGIGLHIEGFGFQSIPRNQGTASEWFPGEHQIWAGDRGIGHNRYVTFGQASMDQVQPVMGARLMLAHNGNLPDIEPLARFVEQHGRSLRGKNDSMLMHEAVDIGMQRGAKLPDAVRDVYELFRGAFSVVGMSGDTTVGFKDRYAVKPLAFGIDPDRAFVFSSETRAFELVTKWREVGPGEMLVVEDSRVQSEQLAPACSRPDSFEPIYFMRPDSEWEGKLVAEYRANFGREMAEQVREQGGPRAGLVLGVPDSAIIAARAFAAQLGIIYVEDGIRKAGRVTQRGFMTSEEGREEFIRRKYQPVNSNFVNGQSVYVGDDSLIRGQTLHLGVVEKVRQAGARQVHGIIFSPPAISSHEHGAYMPTHDLVHFGRSTEEVARILGLDSLSFLTVDGLCRALGRTPDTVSNFAFTGTFLPETQHLSPIPQRQLAYA